MSNHRYTGTPLERGTWAPLFAHRVISGHDRYNALPNPQHIDVLPRCCNISAKLLFVYSRGAKCCITLIIAIVKEIMPFKLINMLKVVRRCSIVLKIQKQKKKKTDFFKG